MEYPKKDGRTVLKKTYTNLEVVDTGVKISGRPSLNGQGIAEAKDILNDKLKQKWDQMFKDKGRIDGKWVRLDQQSFTGDDPQYSNTAIQNNTAQGNRGQDATRSYTSVLIQMTCTASPQCWEAIRDAHLHSIDSGTICEVNWVGESPLKKVAMPLIQITCAMCGKNKSKPVPAGDLIAQGQQLGVYPPSSWRCDQCEKKLKSST